MSQDNVRRLLASRLDPHDAHVGFDRAVADLPEESRGVLPAGFAHSCWQLVEHMRRAQADILDFCVNPRYRHDLTWPDDYWPKTPAPKTFSFRRRSGHTRLPIPSATWAFMPELRMTQTASTAKSSVM